MCYRAWVTAAALLLSSFCSQGVSASTYYWHIGTSIQYSSAVAACEAYYSDAPAFAGYPGGVVTSKNVVVNGGTARCNWQGHAANNPNFGIGGFGTAYRNGQSCNPGDTYNSQTGECEGPQPDQCESSIGAVVHHEFRFASLGSDGNPSTDPPVTVCKAGCQYSHTFGDFSSKRDFGPPDQLVGSFEYKGNGVSCTPSANDPSVFDQPPAKDPVTKRPSTPPATIARVGKPSLTAPSSATAPPIPRTRMKAKSNAKAARRVRVSAAA